MHEKLINRDQVKEIIEKYGSDNIYIFSDKKWRYPAIGDDQKSCPMLDMNFMIEKKPGIVIYIPGKSIGEKDAGT